jgi:hypothetical protein
MEFSTEEVEYYTAIKRELAWYESEMANTLDIRDQLRMQREYEQLLEQFWAAVTD